MVFDRSGTQFEGFDLFLVTKVAWKMNSPQSNLGVGKRPCSRVYGHSRKMSTYVGSTKVLMMA